MGTALLTEFRIAAPAGTISIPRAVPPLLSPGGDRYAAQYAGRSCARPPGIRGGRGDSLLQILATVLVTAVAVTAILCIAHVRTSQVAAEATHAIPAVADTPSPIEVTGTVTGGR